MYFDAEMEKIFVKSYLGPTLKGNSLTKDIHIMLLDHNRDLLPDYPVTILKDSQAAAYVSGTAVHWYNDQHASADKLSQVPIIEWKFDHFLAAQRLSWKVHFVHRGLRGTEHAATASRRLAAHA